LIPVHLNELPPDDARGTFPGFTYELGNLIASVNAPLQAAIAAQLRQRLRACTRCGSGVVAVVIVILTGLGSEAKGVAFGKARLAPATTAVGARPGWRGGPKIARIGYRGASYQPAIPRAPFKTLNFSPSTAQTAYVGCCPFFDRVPPAFRQEAGFKLETVRGQHCWP
jgi:hypothetical protein